MAEEDYTVVKNVRGKAAVWRWFGLKKRKTDGHIEQNIAVCFDCGVSVKLAGGTSNLQTHIRRHHPLKRAVRSRSKSVVQAEASTLVYKHLLFFFFFFFILPCSITERFTVLICLVYKHLFFLFFFFGGSVLFFFFFFFNLKYTLGKGKLCLERLKKLRLLQYLGVSDVNTIKRKKQ